MNLYQLTTPEHAASIVSGIKSTQWAEGKARTKELTGTVKQNSEILDSKALKDIGQLIIRHPAVQLNCIPHRLHPPKFSRYTKGQRYLIHTDSPWMGETRTDLSCTLWLNDDYEGGELCIDGKKIKGKPGQAMIYPCELPHEVLPVTKGERICAITWIESRIRDPHKRKLISDMRKFLSKFEDNQPLFVEGGRIHSALIRMWME